MLCFLDDILIFSAHRRRSTQQHLREVLHAAAQSRSCTPSSASAHSCSSEVAFLGHRIGADGLRVSPDKISAVQQWPQPQNVSDVRSFLGLAGFYRRFVQGLQQHRAAADRADAREATPWQLGRRAAGSVRRAQGRAVLRRPCCWCRTRRKPFVLNCDACKYAIGATLQQDHGNGLQPVAYFSAKMSDAERNYDVREQEFMALVRRVPALAALPARHAAVHAADGPRLAQVPQDDAEPQRSPGALDREDGGVRLQAGAHPGQGQRGGGRAQQARGSRAVDGCAHPQEAVTASHQPVRACAARATAPTARSATAEQRLRNIVLREARRRARSTEHGGHHHDADAALLGDTNAAGSARSARQWRTCAGTTCSATSACACSASVPDAACSRTTRRTAGESSGAVHRRSHRHRDARRARWPVRAADAPRRGHRCGAAQLRSRSLGERSARRR